MMNRLKNFFWGKLHRKTFDLVRATAVFTMTNGTQHSVQREGILLTPFGRPMIVDGRYYLDRSILGEKTILRSDHGVPFLVSQAIKVEVFEEPVLVEHEWRDWD